MNINIEKFDYVEWEKLVLFQPGDLKSQSKDQLDKLKTSLKNNGFKSPFMVWENKDNIYVLDGHQRLPAIKLLIEEGVNVPPTLPAVFIKCKDKKEAKKAVLIYNSHYAKISNDILMDWVVDLKIDDIKMEIDIPEIDFDFYKNNNYDYTEFEKHNTELEGFEDEDILITVPSKYAEEVKKILSEGKSKTSAGMGQGVLILCGLL